MFPLGPTSVLWQLTRNMATEVYPNRKGELIAWNFFITILVTIFVFWRVLARFRINPRLWLSDYLMIIAWVRQLKASLFVAFVC